VALWFSRRWIDFVWWRGVRPDTAAVIRALTVPLL
jgi:hypothetical protein